MGFVANSGENGSDLNASRVAVPLALGLILVALALEPALNWFCIPAL